jgi:hypothetical protein
VDMLPGMYKSQVLCRQRYESFKAVPNVLAQLLKFFSVHKKCLLANMQVQRFLSFSTIVRFCYGSYTVSPF